MLKLKIALFRTKLLQNLPCVVINVKTINFPSIIGVVHNANSINLAEVSEATALLELVKMYDRINTMVTEDPSGERSHPFTVKDGILMFGLQPLISLERVTAEHLATYHNSGNADVAVFVPDIGGAVTKYGVARRKLDSITSLLSAAVTEVNHNLLQTKPVFISTLESKSLVIRPRNMSGDSENNMNTALLNDQNFVSNLGLRIIEAHTLHNPYSTSSVTILTSESNNVVLLPLKTLTEVDDIRVYGM